MAQNHADLVEQLRLACKSSGARWAAWITLANRSAADNDPPAGAWLVGPQTGLSKARQKALEKFLDDETRRRWIGGSLANARPRWQETGPGQAGLDCERVYVYPCGEHAADDQRCSVLLAGADGLSAQGEVMLRLVGLRPPECLAAGEAARPEQAGLVSSPAALGAGQMEALYETSLEITARLELNTLLQNIARRARELAAARGAEVGLIEPILPAEGQPEGAASPTGGLGVRLVISETPWPAMQGIFIPFMTGLAGKIAAQAISLNIPDYNTWDERLLPERYAPFKAAAGVPLMIGSEVIGTLTVLDDRPEKQFSAGDVQILKMFGAQAAIAIHNARLYAELSNRMAAQLRAEKQLVQTAQLAAVGDISTQIANEINAPIRRTALLLDMVLQQLPEDASLPPSALRDLRLAQQAAQRAREMTNRLLRATHDTRPVD